MRYVIHAWMTGLAMVVMTIPTLAQTPDSLEKLFSSVMPKKETQALEFLQKYPDYDGRNVVVAVLDTGVDPAAKGLRITPDGKTKVIDIIDATGAGDVSMSHKQKASKTNPPTLTGIRDNALIIPGSWNNPSGDFFIGTKNAYEILPEPAIGKYKQKAKTAREAMTRNRVRKLEKDLLASDLSSDQKKELNEQIRQLNDLQISYNPPSPILDCLTFFDGEHWVAAIDTNRNNDFRDEKLLRDYDIAYELGSLDPELGVSFGVHIYDEGKTLSIVADAGAHGTHVAGIIAGYFPENPAFNGVAPGAKIVSIKIGDNRLGTMETMTAMERALSAVVKHKCDLINMSYGEPTTTPDQGRLSHLIHETVREKNVIFVASAGNAGPALYTVGSPGGTTGPVLGIGAYISPAMVREQYALADEISEGFYTWSSRGPTFDGDPGVDFAAPGGAFAPVPQWSGNAKQQMNGTSMAAPNACGNIALILSGMKANGISYTPIKIERALSASARLINDASRFAQGRGLIQTLDAYEKLTEFSSDIHLNTPIDIQVNQPDSARGIQIFVEPGVPQNKSYRVSLKPWFAKNTPLQRKLNYERTLVLKARHPWIQVPSNVVLQSGGNSVNVRIDVSESTLQSIGQNPFFTEVEVYDYDSQNFGPVARIPISILPMKDKPVDVDTSSAIWNGGGPFNAGDIERVFVNPPAWAQFAEIKFLRKSGPADGTRVVFHSVQRIPGRNYRHHQLRRYLMLDRDKETSQQIELTGGVPMEIALAPFWSESQSMHIDWTIQFFGDRISPDPLVIEGNQGITPITIHPAPDQRERTIISPKGSLDRLWRTLKPEKADISPLLDQRDLLVDDNYSYELVLSYRFSLDKSTSVKPVMQAFQDRLYESEFSSQLWEIRNASNHVIHSDDTWPDPVRLDAGEYVLRYHFRHPDQKFLEKIKGTPLALEMPVSGIALQFFVNPDDYLLGRASGFRRTLKPGDKPVKFHAGVPFSKGIPQSARPGDILVGKVSWIEDDASTSWNESNPTNQRVIYSLPLSSSASELADSKSDNALVSKEGIERTIRNARLAHLRSIPASDSENFDKAWQNLMEMDPDWLEVIQTKLHRLDNDDRKERLDQIIETCNELLSKMDQNQLGRIINTPDTFLSEAEKKEKKLAKNHKEILVDALYRKCRAIAYVEDSKKAATDGAASGEEEELESFEMAFKELAKWVDTTSEDFILVHIRDLRRKGQIAAGLKSLKPFLNKTHPNDKKFHKKKLKLLEELGWDEWADTQRKFLFNHYPINPDMTF